MVIPARTNFILRIAIITRPDGTFNIAMSEVVHTRPIVDISSIPISFKGRSQQIHWTEKDQ